ncbi:tetratricopeptide repeat protein [Bernardetia sp. Wsw4-3y2]|uniref:tetratricopeptide repeat protein n=1 Tax=unclassified Bernardetia TaxID=2647129 RepID=UPI0030D5D37F
MKFIFILLFSFSLSTCFAQPQSIDEKTNSSSKDIDYKAIAEVPKEDLKQIIDGVLYRELALKSFNESDYQKALTYLDVSYNLLKKYKPNRFLSKVHFLYARIYSNQGNSKKAISELKKSLKYNNMLFEVQTTLSYEYLQISKNKKALKAARKALEINPKSAYAYNNAGLALIRLKKHEEGKKMIMSSLYLKENNPYTYKNLFYYYFATNNLEKACESLQKAKSLGYKEFGNESDQNEVEELIKKHCK